VGAMVSIRPTTKFSASPAQLRLFAPVLGQHTQEVLLEAGFDEAGIAQLQQDKVIRTASSY
jgi:crotonobetainyl-CoA:carnitine CoA-transferase CaiB-like acyl-CoA transferase